MGVTNGNGNKTRINLGSGMEMNHWEWEGMGLRKTFPLISTSVNEQYLVAAVMPCGWEGNLREK